MASSNIQRKLTAILSADVAGYSRLMGADEEATIETLTTYRKVFTSEIKNHRGSVVDAKGDAILAEFASVVDAVNSAVEIQRELAERNAELPDDRRMDFRIGINLGDVVVKDEVIYGDGVNIAARVESLAEAGGVCISGSVYAQVRNKLKLEYEFLGKKEVKNIEESVPVYRVLSVPGAAAHRVIGAKKKLTVKWRKIALAAAVLVVLGAGGLLGWNYFQQLAIEAKVAAFKAGTALPLPEKPSIAVLPFTNISGDAEQEYFADGMTDDLITDLSKVGGLFVIASNSMFTYKGRAVTVQQVAEELGIRYVLEGSVRRAGSQVRINAQLIDAATGGHLWAERYDGKMDDVFALQDRITTKIVSALAVQLRPGKENQVARKETGNPEAYDAFLKGWALYRRKKRDDFAQAVSYLEEAVGLDPEYSRAYAALALAYSKGARRGWNRSLNLSYGEAWLKAKKYLAEAMKDPVPLAHSAAANIHRAESRYQDAITAAAQAIALDASDPAGYAAMGLALIWAGSPAEAVDFIKKAIRLDPNFAENYLGLLGQARFGMEQFEEAVTALERAARSNPDYEWTYLLLAAAYGQLGREREARAALETHHEGRAKSGFSPWTLEKLYTMGLKERTDLERLREGLRIAGMPPGRKPVADPTALIYQSKEGREVRGATTIDAATAKALFDRGVPFIDVRYDYGWERGHIPGAIHLHANIAFSEAALSRIVSKEQEVVIHCSGPG